MRALHSRPVGTLPLWLLRFKGFFRCFIVLILRWFNHEELALFAAMFAAPRGLDVVEGAVGLGMAGREVTFVLRTSWEIVYPCIPDPDGEDEGGQVSSSLAVPTRWISVAKLLQSDLTTLAQREGGK
ncbi:hypothetical protein B296_00031203 [Ensete ventricosum]|uniref:Uncharacterized protein n=1 Tax=Ensete ventricosum TaxID=4639 RepID=A0A426WWN4_ENSVE|nr:hypothetical protein B296_00031203 [Ensete ventricosum]